MLQAPGVTPSQAQQRTGGGLRGTWGISCAVTSDATACAWSAAGVCMDCGKAEIGGDVQVSTALWSFTLPICLCPVEALKAGLQLPLSSTSITCQWALYFKH